MNRLHQLRWQTRAFYSQFGLLPTVLGLVAEALCALRINKLRSHRFQFHDSRMLGQATAGRVEREELDLSPELAANAVAYEPTPAYQFYAVLSELGSSWSAYSFVDYGCGKGRVLSLAMRLGFGRVTGIEVSRKLALEAESYLEGLEFDNPAGTQTVEVICSDATCVPPPPTPWVVFLFNPFNEQVLEPVIRNLEASRERSTELPSYLLYKNPRHAELFDRSPSFQRVSHPMGGGWIVYRFCDREDPSTARDASGPSDKSPSQDARGSEHA